jgi:hypothetical protein
MKFGHSRSEARTTILLLVVAASIGASIACASAPRQRPVEGGPVDTGPGTLTAARKYLEGRWTLEWIRVFPPGKPPVELKATGTLDYDNSSNLRMEIRADQDASDVLRAAGIDIRDGVISTEGRTAIDLHNRTLTYVMQGQQPLIQQGPLGQNRPRHWTVEGDILTLTTKDDAGNPPSVGRWRKVQ